MNWQLSERKQGRLPVTEEKDLGEEADFDIYREISNVEDELKSEKNRRAHPLRARVASNGRASPNKKTPQNARKAIATPST